MKLTKKHFELFKSECLKWVDRFELNGWRIYFSWQDGKGAKDKYAGVNYNLGGRNATFLLSKDWTVDLDPQPNVENQIRESAKHEVIHLLLGRLSVNSSSRHVSVDDLDESEEELVRKLEKIIGEK